MRQHHEAGRYVVVGNPVEHSRSPTIHRLFAEQTGEHIEYGRMLAPPGQFVPTVRAFAESGGAGCNVTVPFKFEALEAATHRTPRAALAQAANWLGFGPDGWTADNTDGAGLVRDIEINAGRSLAGARVLLLGAGGAAAGALAPLVGQQPSAVVISNRSLDKARALVARHAPTAAEHGVALAVAALDASIAFEQAPFDIVINATSTSLQGQPVPVPGGVLAAGALAVDMMYGPPAQAFLAWATQHGAQARDGLGMLVEQAAEAFWLWRGVRPETAAVLQSLQNPPRTS